MRNMFGGAISFNQDLSGWDVSMVTNMRNMFGGATSFNQDLSGWDVSKVTDMSDIWWCKVVQPGCENLECFQSDENDWYV